MEMSSGAPSRLGGRVFMSVFAYFGVCLMRAGVLFSHDGLLGNEGY